MRRALVLVLLAATPAFAQDDPLSSWNDGPAKQAILDFVAAATTEGSPDWIAPGDRIATFDNDGTLWSEQPMYFQVACSSTTASRTWPPTTPSWASEKPYKAVPRRGHRPRSAPPARRPSSAHAPATHGGMTTDEFQAEVKDWLATARHPRFDRPYTELVYQPMLEVLDYLRANGFQTWIVSGGGVEFIRPFSEQVYGIPPEQVVGSQIEVTYNDADGPPRFDREPEVNFVDDKAGKPVGILRHIGRRAGHRLRQLRRRLPDAPIRSPPAPARGLGLIVHHTDAVREYAYDRDSPSARSTRALDAAPAEGWRRST